MTQDMQEIAAEIKRLTPPSPRDREIFHAVVGEGLAQQAVAEKHGITQARVSQIVASVREWLCNASDEEAGEVAPDKRVRYGERVVRMRLEALLTTSMQCFRESKGMVPSRKTRDNGLDMVREEVLKTSFGEVRYLTHYRQVAFAIARLDGVNLTPRVERAKAAAPATPTAVAVAVATAAAAPVAAAVAATTAVPPAVAADLYPAAAGRGAGETSATQSSAVTASGAMSSKPQSERNPASPPAAEGEKTAYKSPVRSAVRRDFLRDLQAVA